MAQQSRPRLSLLALDAGGLARVYESVYRRAFPPNELRPLAAMQALTESGVYRTQALWDGTRELAYISLWQERATVLIDYLCVPEKLRGQGWGGKLLRMTRQDFPPETVFLLESEAPVGDESRDGLIERRLAFYRRCGAVTLDYDTALFGVHYKTLAWSAAPVDTAEAMMTHAEIYRRQLGPELYARAVRIPYLPGEELPSFDSWKE